MFLGVVWLISQQFCQRLEFLPLAMSRKPWLISDCEIAEGKSLGPNQWDGIWHLS